MSEWQDISTAPKDRHAPDILLYRPTALPWAQIVTGCWEDDRYAKKPRPYFRHSKEHVLGKVEGRTNHPTHWMPLPAPPAAMKDGG